METNQAIQDILETVTFIKDNAVMRDEFLELKNDVSELKKDMVSVKATMVTKDYLDDKLADLKGDLTVLMRKEDRKVATLVGMLQKKNVRSLEEAKQILTMEPFPQIL